MHTQNHDAKFASRWQNNRVGVGAAWVDSLGCVATEAMVLVPVEILVVQSIGWPSSRNSNGGRNGGPMDFLSC